MCGQFAFKMTIAQQYAGTHFLLAAAPKLYKTSVSTKLTENAVVQQTNRNSTERKKTRNFGVTKMYLRIVVFSVLFVWIHGATEESPGFFLKVSKNIPRLGRRSAAPLPRNDYESFFLKSSKIVPRIGRSNSAYV